MPLPSALGSSPTPLIIKDRTIYPQEHRELDAAQYFFRRENAIYTRDTCMHLGARCGGVPPRQRATEESNPPVAYLARLNWPSCIPLLWLVSLNCESSNNDMWSSSAAPPSFALRPVPVSPRRTQWFISTLDQLLSLKTWFTWM